MRGSRKIYCDGLVNKKVSSLYGWPVHSLTCSDSTMQASKPVAIILHNIAADNKTVKLEVSAKLFLMK